MIRPLLVFAIGLLGCSTAHGPATGSFRFNGLEADGEIQVMPLVSAHAPLQVRLDDYVADGISLPRELIRRERTAQVQTVPAALGTALPGAIHARLDPSWRGSFRVARAPARAQDRLLTALRRDDPERLEATLIELARGAGGSATLFSWVSDLTATPVSTLDAPGATIDGPQGTLLVDLFEEPYLIDAEIGLALVTADGHVIVRYTDTASALLSPDRSPSRTGWALAESFASEICKVWPDDPGLYDTPGPSESAVAAHMESEIHPRRPALTWERPALYGRDGSRRVLSAIGGASPETP